MSTRQDKHWRLIEQGGQGLAVDLPSKGTLILGSSPERAGFVLAGQGVEAAHCAIGCVKSGGWAVKDLGSQFGTFVNGTKVQSKRLKLGDTLVLGSVRLEIQEATQQAPQAPSPKPQAPQPTRPSAAGRQLGGYRIESTLGKGGMGEVVLALQESLHRHVALKLLSTKWASDREFVRAFHSEARSAAALSHPNVVVVYDVGEAAGQHYLAMEYMPGGSLEECVLKQGRLPWREVLNILHDAAAGLAYAESQGIVHRDIKPANLMLAASGAVKIADLGLALNVDEQGEGDSAEGRKTFGTPHFISPEQARGLAVDQRSDLYSLGATAYRLLSGRTPFQGETTREIVRARFIGDPPPLANSVPGMPEGLHRLVHKLMQREPAARFGSARELLSEVDLLRLRADHGTTEGEPAAGAPKGSKAGLWLGAVGLLAVLGALYFLMGEKDAPESIQESPDQVADSGAKPRDRGDASESEDSAAFFGDQNPSEELLDSTDSVEQKLLNLERDAIAELGRIPAELSVQERIVELELFIQRFAGTDTANLAQAEAERLRTSSLEAERLALARDQELQRALEALRTNIGWPQPATNPANLATLLERLGAVLPPPALAGAPAYLAGLLQLRDEIVAQLSARVQAELQAAEALAAAGDFGALRRSLASAGEVLWPGPATPGEPAVFGELRAKCQVFRARLEGLPAAELEYALRLRSRDRRQLASSLGPGSNLREEMLNLEFTPALARMQATREQLTTDESRADLGRVQGRFQAAQRALERLASSHAEGLWKRKSISVPKTEVRSYSREAISILPEGILVEEEDASALVRWADFARSEAALAQLFKSRLSRPWTQEESADIASLLSLPAIAKALELAGKDLLTDSQAELDSERVQRIMASFDETVAWIEEESGISSAQLAETQSRPAEQSAPQAALASILRERRALQVLTQALVAYQENLYSLCISLTETLLTDYSQTLLVQMLSNGST